MNKENRPAADYLPEEDESTSSPTGSSPQTWSHQFFGEYGRLADMGTHASGEEDVECANVIVDNTSTKYASLQSHVIVPGASTAALVTKYSPTLSLDDMADLVTLPIATAHPVVPRVSNSILMPSDSRVKKLLLKLIRKGGDGVITPKMWNAIISATSGEPPRRGGSPPDLPEGIWGDIIWDINANSGQMQDLYVAEDDVLAWPDETGLGHDVAPTSSFLVPKYKPTGFNGKPCVEWDGGNVGMETASTQPTAAVGSYTYYFMLDNLDGGDGARIWGAGFFDSFQYSLYVDADEIYAANNNLFGGASLFATDTWGMADPHVYRYVKDSGSVKHYLFVDGVLMAQATTSNPGVNNNGVAHLMNALTGLGMTGRLARGVAYNTSHLSSSVSGPAASGTTAPEDVLMDFYGI